MKPNRSPRYRLRSLFAAVGALALVLTVASSLFRWQQGNAKERHAILEVCNHGATYTTESALAASAGKRPTWLHRTLTNGVAKIDFSLAMRRDVAGRGITPLPVTDEHLRHLKEIRGSRQLDLRGSPQAARRWLLNGPHGQPQHPRQ